MLYFLVSCMRRVVTWVDCSRDIHLRKYYATSCFCPTNPLQRYKIASKLEQTQLIMGIRCRNDSSRTRLRTEVNHWPILYHVRGGKDPRGKRHNVVKSGRVTDRVVVESQTVVTCWLETPNMDLVTWHQGYPILHA